MFLGLVRQADITRNHIILYKLPKIRPDIRALNKKDSLVMSWVTS